MHIRHSLNYFEEWKNHCDHVGDSDSFLSMITCNNLRITVCGFLAYTRLVLHSRLAETGSIFYVPALHSNMSTLKSWFSLVRSMHKDSTRDYETAGSTRNAANGINTVKGQRNKCYSLTDVAEQQDKEATTLEKAFSHRDSNRTHKLDAIMSRCIHVKQTNNDNNFWNPFLKDASEDVTDVLETTCFCHDHKRMARTTEICNQIICCDVVGIQSLFQTCSFGCVHQNTIT